MNPLMVPHIQTYPEHSGERLDHPRQAHKWRDEVPANIVSPMALGENGKAYFIEVPCFANLDKVGNIIGPIIPTRFFERTGKIWAKVRPLLVMGNRQYFTVDERDGQEMELRIAAIFLSVEDLQLEAVQRKYGIPSPDRIIGKCPRKA